jgi:hypothetical protein
MTEKLLLPRPLLSTTKRGITKKEYYSVFSFSQFIKLARMLKYENNFLNLKLYKKKEFVFAKVLSEQTSEKRTNCGQGHYPIR